MIIQTWDVPDLSYERCSTLLVPGCYIIRVDKCLPQRVGMFEVNPGYDNILIMIKITSWMFP